MKIILFAASISLLFACTTSEQGGGSETERAAQDTILQASDAIPADDKAAAKQAAESWDATPGLSPENCAGCKDKNGNTYAPGYTTCFGSIKVTCKGRMEKEPAGSGCYEEADWYKQTGECK